MRCTNGFGLITPSRSARRMFVGLPLKPSLVVLLVIVSIAGCDIPQRPPISGIRSSAMSEPESITAQAEIFEPPRGDFEPWESWDVFYVGQKPVGYAHLVAKWAEPLADGRHAHYHLSSELIVQRGDAEIHQRLDQTSTESPEGRLREFESFLHVGPVVTQLRGVVDDDELQIETVRGTTRLNRTIPWESTYRGLAALEQSLRRDPMRSRGQRRALTMLLPGQYELGTARMTCRGTVSIPRIDGTPVEAIEIDVEIDQGDLQPAQSTIWTDDDGRLLRTYSPGLRLFAYRTDQYRVSRWTDRELSPISIAVRGKVNDPKRATRIAFVIQPLENVEAEIPVAPGQYVRQLSDGKFQVLVSRQAERPSAGFVSFESEVTEMDREPNFFVDSADPSIQRLIEVAIRSLETPDREIALELAQTLQRTTEKKIASDGLTKASDVWQRRQGDCTGRATLLTALLRASDIPARVVWGLRFDSEDVQRMHYHAWTIAWIDGGWISLDADDRGVAMADRIALVTTDLAGPNDHDALVKMMNLLAGVTIEVVGQR